MKASARHILSTQFEIPEYAKGNQELWNPLLVRKALVEAYRVLSDTTGRVGPKRMKGFWPEYKVEYGDLTSQAAIGRVDRVKVRRRRTTVEIQRMEMALLGWKGSDGRDHPAWLTGAVRGYDSQRKMLVAWVMAEFYHVPDRELCLYNKWALATFKRHRDFAAGIIADQLNRAGVEPW